MRLLKEMPEVEAKIESGALNLSNIARAQVYFRDIKRTEPARIVSPIEKAAILEQLEQKSTREGERILLAMTPPEALPRERERLVTPDHIELRLIINTELKNQLEEVRSLMGPQGARLNMAELIAEMTRLSVEKLKEKKFGKRRTQMEQPPSAAVPLTEGATMDTVTLSMSKVSNSGAGEALRHKPTPAVARKLERPSMASRYIPQSIKHAVWHAAGGKCSCCGSRQNLQFDHVQPVALVVTRPLRIFSSSAAAVICDME